MSAQVVPIWRRIVGLVLSLAAVALCMFDMYVFVEVDGVRDGFSIFAYGLFLNIVGIFSLCGIGQWVFSGMEVKR